MLLREFKKRLFGLVTRFINRSSSLRGVTINGICRFNKKTYFGTDCHFNGVFIDGPGQVIFGHSCHFGRRIRIFTQNHNYRSESAIPYDDTFIIRPVSFGNYVWVGSDVIVLPGASIGNGVVIQAGAVVHGKLEDCGIYGGNPAVKIGTRDVDIFNRLNKYK